MATFTAGTSFTDGVTGDVTAAKLNALVANATPLSNLITDRTAETSIATDDLVLISDTSDSGALNKMTVSNLMKAEMTGTINSTAGTITTATIPNLTAGTTTGTAATFTSGTITTGVIPTLTSTTLITSGTGTASAPAIAPTGDTNTGAFFPAADTAAISTAGSERVRVDSSGNVGIGTTSPNIEGGGGVYLTANGGSSRGNILAETSAANADGTLMGIFGFSATTQDTGHRVPSQIFGELEGTTSNKRGGRLCFHTKPDNSSSLTERLRIDSSGNVGIGNTSPTSYNSSGDNLVIGNTGDNGITIVSGTDGKGYLFFADGVSGTNAYAGQVDFDHSVNALRFGVLGTERLRIDSSGNVGIGLASPVRKLEVNGYSGNGTLAINSGSANAGTLYFANGGTGTSVYNGFIQYDHSANAMQFATNQGTERLRITSGGEVYIAGTTDQGAYNLQVNGTGVWGAGAYVNGSDERLKENIQDITSGLDVVEKLRPVSFQYKEDYTADRSVQSGFIAQDLLVALEGKNYLDGVVSQGPTYYNVAYQNLIPILAKAIQELKAENDSLKTRIAALEAA